MAHSHPPQAPSVQLDPSVATSTERADAQLHGLYDPANEHDACGVGFVAQIGRASCRERV